MAETGEQRPSLSEQQREQAIVRFSLLQPFLEHSVPLSTIAREHEIPLRTAQQWVTQYRRHGLAGLARQLRADRGHHRGLPIEAERLIEGLALQKPPCSIAWIHRKVLEIAKEQHWPQPSYSLVYQIVRRLNPALVTLAHEGGKAYREEFDLLYRREASHANAMWQADHTFLDLWVQGTEGKAVQPWLTIILDDYSRAIAGYQLSFQAPSALQTALTLRQAIWRKDDSRWHVCGIPSTFYTDHGSDFTSTHMEQVAADIKMHLIFSLPGTPRGRGKIERFFATVNQMVLPNCPGYGSTAPEAEKITSLLTLEAFEVLFRDWLLSDYHARVQQETKSAPQARWEAGGFLPRMPESLEQLDILLLTVSKARRIQQDGIHFHGHRYLDLLLAAYVGEEVMIRYDPHDMAEIRIYYQESFLCRAICPELAGQSISLKEIQNARNAQRKQVRKELTERQAVVETYLAVHHEPHSSPEPEPPLPSAPRLKRYANE